MQKIKKNFAQNNEIYLESVKTNYGRMKKVVFFGIPVSLLHLIMFVFFVKADNSTEIVWRAGIILLHIVLITMYVFTLLIVAYLKQKEISSLKTMLFLQYLYIFLIIVLGVAIVSIDQLVTTSITPFLVICTVIALVFLLKPLASVPIYITAYLIFYFSIELTQNNPSVLASNRVNGITAAAIGIALSNILWQYYSKDFLQKKLIEKQNAKLEMQKKDLEEINIKLTYMASCDELTGLLNRREFEKLIERALLEIPRHDNKACIILVDIDYFKNINDSYGHPIGDEILKQFSFILKTELREIDLLARWGGEEFIIMLHNTSAKEGFPIAERIRSAIENKIFFVDGKEIQITASFGIADLKYLKSNSLNSSYQKADKALYTAKNNGKNQCILAKTPEVC